MKTSTSILQTMHPLSARYRGADLSGEDISGWVFTGADLRGANLSGAYGTNVDFRCANMRDVDLSNAHTGGWNCMAADMRGANLTNAQIGATMHFVNLEAATLTGVNWKRGGHAGARAVILPKHVDFSTWEGGQGFHAAVAKLIEQNTDDAGALRACDYILGQTQRFYYHKDFPCWVGLVQMCQAELKPASIEAIHQAFVKYPNMRLMTMWQWAEREIKKGAK